MGDRAFKRVLVWSGWLRFSHGSVGLATLVLLLTGWLLAESPSLAPTALDLHYYAAAFLVFGLLIRFALMLLGQQHERLVGLLPRAADFNGYGETLRFYFSLGKTPAPRSYAHNPLWKPVYLLIYLVLIIQLASGTLMPERDLLSGFYLPSVHAFWADVLLWISILHIAAVSLQDARGKTADVSAMLNGYRLFFIERRQFGDGQEQLVQFTMPDKPGHPERDSA